MAKRNWTELPDDITAVIISRLPVIDVLTSAQIVCMKWHKICNEPLAWRTIDMHGHNPATFDKMFKMCRHAVDRSSGNLVNISLGYFCNDDLLEYITNSSKKIRRILLTGCRSISDKGLSRVASELPLLEELDISFCEGISHKSLQAVGRSCPLLKSFRLNKGGLAKQLAARTLDEIRGFFFEYADEDALAIAGAMHGLQHLQLVGNPLSVMGLQKILYGCPHLKSLKLRWCSNINVATQVLEEDALHKLRSLEYSQFTDDKGLFSRSLTDSSVFDIGFYSMFR